MLRILLIVFGLSLSSGLFAQDWEFTGGPGGATLSDFTIAPNGDLYLVTESLHRSTDNGLTWKRIAHEVPLLNIFGSVLSTITAHKNGSLFIGSPFGVWKSSDKGNTWKNTLVRNGRSFQFDIAVSDKGTVIYLADSNFVSTDHGESWRLENRISPKSKVIIDSSDIIYVTNTNAGAYRSTNQGASWAKLINGFPSNSGLGDVVTFAKDSVITYTQQRDVYVSGDHGRTWIKRATVGNYQVLALLVAEKHLYLLQADGVLLRSTDHGFTWEHFDETFRTNIFPSPSAFSYYGENLYIRKVSEIIRRSLSSPIWDTVIAPNASVYSMAIHPSGGIFAVGEKVWSFNQSGLWDLQQGLSATTICIDSAGNIIVGRGQQSYLSQDRGASWSLLEISHAMSYPVSLSANKEGMIFSLTSDGFFRTLDQMKTWDQLNEGIVDVRLTALDVGELGLLYAAGGQRFYRSTNFGFTWEEQLLPFITGTEAVRTITHRGNTVIVGADKTGAYFSTDQGVTWENHSTGLKLDTIYQILITPNGSVFAATTSGLYEYSESSKSWREVGDNGVDGIILSLALAPDGKLYAGTAGGGVYRSTKIHRGVVDLGDANAMTMYPNPASAELHIEFPEPGNYRILIYNILGEACLAQTSEGKSTTLDVSSLANGKYFLRLAGDKTVTRQFVIRN